MINLRLDPNFQPMILKLREFKARVAESESKVPVAFCVERNNGYIVLRVHHNGHVL